MDGEEPDVLISTEHVRLPTLRSLTSRRIGRHYPLERRLGRKIEYLRNMIKDRIKKGDTFSRLTVLSLVGKKRYKQNWLCQCVCGAKLKVDTYKLLSKNTKSCGCLRRDTIQARARTHGQSRTRFYRIWKNIKRRTALKYKDWEAYAEYSGRGITLCLRWQNFLNFKKDLFSNYEKHVAEFGEKNTSLDRIDNNGHYEPQNVRFATQKEQSRNTRTCSKITYKGKTKTYSEWSDVVGINRQTLYDRLNKLRWPIEKAMETRTKNTEVVS